MIRNKLHTFIISIVTLVVLFPFPILAETEENSLHYVSLGNSLAAGYLNDGTRGNGYPVYIQNGIEENYGLEVELTNGGVGGYRTVDVLAQLEGNSNNILNAIAEAEILTIDIGANDVLRAVDLENLDESQILIAIETIEQVKHNLKEILKFIKEENPSIKIYVMGYYNALPFYENQDIIQFAISALNNAIKETAQNNGAVYVPTFDAFEGLYEQFLPNPDIHPTEEGYKVIARAFLNKMHSVLHMHQFKGTDGNDGLNGQDGKDGSTWYTGDGLPSEWLGNSDDSYLAKDSGDVYVKSGKSWEFDVNIVGPAGDKGEEGDSKHNKKDNINQTEHKPVENNKNHSNIVVQQSNTIIKEGNNLNSEVSIDKNRAKKTIRQSDKKDEKDQKTINEDPLHGELTSEKEPEPMIKNWLAISYGIATLIFSITAARYLYRIRNVL